MTSKSGRVITRYRDSVDGQLDCDIDTSAFRTARTAEPVSMAAQASPGAPDHSRYLAGIMKRIEE